MNTGTPVSPGCPCAFRPSHRAAAGTAAVALLLLLSSGGSDRLTLLSGFLAGALLLPWDRLLPPAVLGGTGRAMLLASAAVALLGTAVSPVPRQAALIGLDILFPVLLALGVAACTGRTGRAWLLILAGALEGGVAIAQRLLSPTRPTGTFGNANYAALVMVLGALAALDLAVASRRARVPAGVAGLLAVTGAVATGSKSAFAALAAGVAVLIWRLPRRFRLLPVAALALVLLTPNPLSHRLTHWSSEDPYAFMRPTIWSMAVEAWGGHPVTGLGPGGFVGWSRVNNRPSETTPTRYAMRPETAHNQPLQTALDYGLPGLALLGGVCWLLAAELLRRLRSGDGAAWAPAAALAAALPPAILFPILESPPLVFVLCLSVTLHRGPAAPAATTAGPPWRIAGIGAATLLAVLLAAEGLHLLGATTRSLPLMRVAAVLPPQNPARWQDLATLRLLVSPLGDRGAATEASAYLEMAALADPTDPGTPLRQAELGLSILNAGGRDPLLVLRVLRLLDSAATLDPLNPFIPFTSGQLLLRGGLAGEARGHLERAIRLEPNYIAARLRLAECLDALGRTAEAAAQRRTARVLASRWRGYAPRSPYEGSVLAIPRGIPGR